MANSDQAFEILIKFGLDPSQARQAVKEIKNIQTATVDAGKKSAEFLAEDEKDTAKSTNRKKELHAAFQSLGQIIPGIGGLARGMFSAMTFGILAAGIALNALREGLAKFNESLKSGLSFGAMLSDFDKFAKLLSEGKIESGNFAEAIRKISRAQDDLTTATNKTIDAIKHQENAQLEGQNKRRALAHARIEELEKTGKLTRAQALSGKLGVDSFFADQERKAKDAAQAATLAAHEKELADAQAAVARLKPLLPGAAGRLGAAKTFAGKGDELFDKQKAAETEIKAEIKRIKDLIQAESGIMQTGLTSTLKLEDYKIVLASNQKLLASVQANLERTRGGREGRDQELNDSKLAADNLKKQIEALTTRINELERNLPQERARAGIDAADRASNAAVESKTRRLQAAGDLGSAGGASSVTVEPISQELLNQITRDIITGLTGTTNVFINSFRALDAKIKQDQGELERELRVVHRKFDAMQNQD